MIAKKKNMVGKTSVYKLLLVCCLFLFGLVSSNFVYAQGDLHDLVIDRSFFNISNASWSADSTRFAFLSTSELETSAGDVLSGVNLTVDAWWQYDFNTSELISQSTWPFQPTLTPTQINTWKPKDFIYTSANGELAFLNRERDSNFLLGNLRTNQIRETDQTGYLGNYNPDAFVISWNNSNSAVVAQNVSLGGTGIIFHITIPNPNNLLNSQMRIFSTTSGTSDFIVFSQEGDRLYDLSPSGNFVLLSGRDIANLPDSAPVFDASPGLIVWNPINDKIHTIALRDTFLPFDIAAAAFSSGDESKLLIVHRRQGLMQVDIMTNDVEILNEQLASASAVYFSPDSCWLAVFEDAQLKFVNLGGNS